MLLKYSSTYKTKPVSQNVFLLSDSCKFNAFKYFPRQFTITTNNSSGKFNSFILSNASSDIAAFLQENPNELQYHINVQDETNVLGKIEQLFQGETVSFTNDDILVASKIQKSLHLEVDYFKKSVFPSRFIHVKNNDKSNEINISHKLMFFTQILQKPKTGLLSSMLDNELRYRGIDAKFFKSIPTFTIKTKKKDYICNIVGVRSSSVISDFISKNPEATVFNYDYEDEQSEFQTICDFFNFVKFELTREKAEIINEISDDLGIECINDLTENFIDNIEKVSQTIDDQQNIIDTIDELFDLLYNIKEKTVENVAHSIIKSNWSKTEESVIELAAFIFQVINTDIFIHPYLIDLLKELDANQDENNKLKIMIPFIVDHLLKVFYSEPKTDIVTDFSFVYPFIFLMYKKGLISQELLIDKLKNCPVNSQLLISWFFPELVENNPKFKYYKSISAKDQILIKVDDKKFTFNLIYPCNPEQIDEYNRMRDKFEYDNEIAIALRNDDVDTFQSIVTKSGEKSLTERLKKNIFEPFFREDPRYLNYAAAYGSIKCFKYLLLNDEKIDNSTLEMSIIGGNNEIIRIVDNECKKNEINERNTQSRRITKSRISFNADYIIQSIKRHKNKLFDWALEQQIDEINKNEIMDTLVICSIENGNAHSLVQLIDNGFNFHTSQNKYSRFLEIASEKGFYLLDNLLLNLINKTPNQEISLNPKSAVSYGNILIFMLFDKYMRQKELETALIKSIENDMMVFIVYFFEVLIKNKFKLENTVRILESAIRVKTNYIFNYLIKKIEILKPLSIHTLDSILTHTFNCQNIDATIKLIDLIHTKNEYKDFTSVVVLALKSNFKEVIQYIVDKKYIVIYESIPEIITDILNINVDIFSLIMDNADQSIKKKLAQYINNAIKETNKPLVEYLLKQGALLDTSLIEAVKTNDLELVEMILKKNNSASYINKISNNGTALYLSVKNNNFRIFKKLISIPGINPSLYHNKFETPLIFSASMLKENFFNELIEFYGEDIKNQKYQLEMALISISKYNYSNNNTNNAQIRMITKILDMNIIDPNFHIDNETLLTYLCKINAVENVKYLLKFDSIDINMYESENGDTPLIVALKNNNFDIVKLLLNHPKIDINMKNYRGKSALVFASELESSEIIELLLENDKLDPNESNLNMAFYLSKFTHLKKFFSFDCLDVNYSPSDEFLEYSQISGNKKFYKTKLIKSILKSDTASFEMIINHPSFDKSESQIRDALYVSLLENQLEIFEKILNMYGNIDINSHIFNGNSLLIESITKNENILPRKQNSKFSFFNYKNNLPLKAKVQDFVTCILNYKNFDSKKSDISRAYILSVTKNTNKNKTGDDLTDLLYEYDCKHLHLIDQLIKEKGSSIMVSNINSVHLIEFLIDHGADPNEPDENGVYPFEKAIQFSIDKRTLGMPKFGSNTVKNYYEILKAEAIDYFINSNKIDFEKQIINKDGNSKFTTYLHIAAGLGSIAVINEIISRKLCNINITNDLGETPLFEACKNNRKDCVKFLFQFDDLDFHHRNNDGEDVIQFLKNRNNNNKEETNKDKKTINLNKETTKEDNKINLNDKDAYLKELDLCMKPNEKVKLGFGLK